MKGFGRRSLSENCVAMYPEDVIDPAQTPDFRGERAHSVCGPQHG